MRTGDFAIVIRNGLYNLAKSDDVSSFTLEIWASNFSVPFCETKKMNRNVEDTEIYLHFSWSCGSFIEKDKQKTNKETKQKMLGSLPNLVTLEKIFIHFHRILV